MTWAIDYDDDKLTMLTAVASGGSAGGTRSGPSYK